jgi:parallel beta-helix repeat protein
MKKNPSKTILTLLLTLCLSITTILQNNITPANAAPSTLIVHNGESIQEAINNASSGDIIYVLSGTYQESIVINKSITLIGENRENTIIDGGGIGNVISIQASDVNISGFTMQNGDPRVGCGIYVELARNVVISNNNIKTNYVGIQMVFSSWNRICENTISVNHVGIQLIYSGGNTIYRNVVSNNHYGIHFLHYSVNNVIYENILSGNDWGAYCSWYSDDNVFYHNNFIDNNYNVYTEETKNTWSFNGEGNYWDDYSGKDLNKDGIGDFPYNITEGNVDYYPLMGIFYKFIVHFGGNIHDVAIISNSTILDFTFKTVAETKARVILFNASVTVVQ